MLPHSQIFAKRKKRYQIHFARSALECDASPHRFDRDWSYRTILALTISRAARYSGFMSTMNAHGRELERKRLLS
jgi:hypothetical protein